MRIGWTIIAAISVLMAGCETHYRNFVHSEYGQTDFDRDTYECRRENSHTRAAIIGGYAAAGTVVNEDMAEQCMKARGWRESP